jgi:hypothetical protein
METRLGVCSACGANYRIPATFTANRAKCKKCCGVVEIGGDAPAASAKPAPVPAPVPASVPRSSAAAPKPAAAAPKAAPKPFAAPASAAKPAPKVAPKPSPGTRQARGAAERVRGAAEQAAERVKGGAPTAARTRSARAKKAGPNMALIAGASVLILGGIGFASWRILFAGKGGNAAQAAEKTAAQTGTPPAATSSEPAGAQAASASTPDKPTGDAPAAAKPAEGAPKPAAAQAPKKPVEAPGDPASVDLTKFPDQEPLKETSAERAEELKTLAFQLIDMDNPRLGTKAKPQLESAGKEAMPFLLNQLKAQDLATEQGMRNGDLIQKIMTAICNGHNFDWHYTLEPKDVYFNKKATEQWILAFNKARDDETYWAKMSKANIKKAEAESAAKDAGGEKRDDF